MSMDYMRANSRYQDGWPGFYVVNPATSITNAGPYQTQAEAEAEKRRADERWGTEPPLTIMRVSEEA